jgi:hypothetical protein
MKILTIHTQRKGAAKDHVVCAKQSGQSGLCQELEGMEVELYS